MNTNNPIHIFWTGGRDSTILLLQVLRSGQPVQPHYILTDSRPSMPRELFAMRQIRREIAGMPHIGELLPTQYVGVEQIETVPWVAHSCAALTHVYPPFAGQYQAICSYAHSKPMPSPCLALVRNDTWFIQSLIREVEHDGHTYKLVPTPQNEHFEIFRPFQFPLLHQTKEELDMTEMAHDFQDVISHCWVCHQPDRRGLPCGVCNPCEMSINEGLGHLFPPSALRRYAIKRRLRRYPHLFLAAKGLYRWLRGTE